MISSAVASRYASALVDVVTSPAVAVEPQAAIQELRAFEQVLKSSSELRTAIASPAVSTARKRAVVGHLADKLRLSRVVRNFLFVLVDKGRTAALPEIVEAFEAQLDERLGFARGEVSSAAELNDAQKQELGDRLGQATGKQMRLRFSVDPELIGGVVARVGSTVYDGSVKGRLRGMQRRLAGE